MPYNTPSDLHVNAPLTNMSVAYRQELGMYVAHKLAPIVPSDKKTDLWFKWNKGDLLRNVAKKRAPNSESQGADVRITQSDPFNCEARAIHQDVSWQADANADRVLNMKRGAARNVTQWLWTALEVDWASTYFKASVWDTDWTGTAGTTDYSTGVFKVWSDANADPITDLRRARQKVQSKTGFWPNRCCFSADVWEIFANHPKVIDRIKYTQLGAIEKSTEDIVSRLIQMEAYVSAAVYNSAAEGATDVVNNIMSKGVLVAYCAPYPAIEVPSAMYTFSWTGLYGASQELEGLGMRMKDIPVPLKDATRIEGDISYDQRLICTDLAIFMDNVLST